MIGESGERMRWILLGSLLLAALPALAQPVRVAVAANFLGPLEQIAEAYAEQGGPALRISAGATGQHYAQIINGAPFDVFLAADQARPARLVAEGHALADSRMTYALGRLVLWAGPGAKLPADGLAGLAEESVRRLAIANPELAPYGLAAQQALQAHGQDAPLADRIIQARSVGQAFQYLATGNVSHALVAASYTRFGSRPQGPWRLVDEQLYAPIRQDAVILEEALNPAGARDFMAFMQGPIARDILDRFGYRAPMRQP